MRITVTLLLLLLSLTASASAQENCPECGFMLLNRFRTKFENGRSWQLHGCARQHYYWLPTSPSLTPQTPNYGGEPTSCPDCGMWLGWIGTRLNQMGRMVRQYRCTRGHIWEY